MSISYRMLLAAACVVAMTPARAVAQNDSTLRVLALTAHADDHAAFAATIYKLSHDLHAQVDLVVITNGEAGFKYSTLAEAYYGLELTRPEIGRRYLPGIRKKEAMAGGKILGVRKYFFLNQPDKAFTLSADTVIRFHWNKSAVESRLRQIIFSGRYNYILTLLPTEGTHGGHKAATIEALEVVSHLPRSRRPIVLGESDSEKAVDVPLRFTGLPGYPSTAVRSGRSSFLFDRTRKFGYRDALDYRIVVNWMIAEHKSQGTMQTLMNAGEVENFWFFDINDDSASQATQRLFDRLALVAYPHRVY